ncbi:MAG: hypothetical protein WBA18_16495 [Terracidiphilus sp.]
MPARYPQASNSLPPIASSLLKGSLPLGESQSETPFDQACSDYAVPRTW